MKANKRKRDLKRRYAARLILKCSDGVSRFVTTDPYRKNEEGKRERVPGLVRI